MTKPVFICLPVAGMLILGSIAAASEDIIEYCRRASTTDERIACLEASLRGEAFLVAEDKPMAASAETSKSMAADAKERSDAGATPAAGNTTPTAAAAAEAPSEGIGAEQVAARNMTREQQLASLKSATGLKVEHYSEIPYRRLVVHLENGQVWRQIAGDDQYFRVDLKRNQTVDIQETSIGGYKLRLNEMRRTIRVERFE